MFEFLVIAILIGVLLAIRNLLKKTGALAHETRVLQRRLESVSEHLTSIASALQAKTIGESRRSEGHKVNLQAIADLEAQLAEVFVRLDQRSSPLGPKEPAAGFRGQPPELQVSPQATAGLAVVPATQSSELPPPESQSESVVLQAESSTSPPKPVLERVPPSPPAPLPRQPAFDWESFTGVKLFAWLGGFALFLGAVFFVKYSIEHSLISPVLRVILGLITGAGLLTGGLWLRRQGYETTVHTLCASGIAILYTDIFAAHSFYEFIGPTPAFLFMILVTVAAFLLAVRLDGRYIAILGLLGGFLTPPLLSTGVDRPIGLFSYVALLDAGLAAVALRKRWGFLVTLSAVGTLAMQVGWTDKFFDISKALTSVVIFLVFPLLYMALLIVADRFKRSDKWVAAPAFLLPLCSTAFAGFLLGFPELGARPGIVFSFLFLLNACVTGLALLRDDYRLVHGVSGSMTFLLLLVWTMGSLTPELLPWALAFYLLFAALHAVFPIALQRWHPATQPYVLGNIFPVLMLVPMMIVVGRNPAHSLLVWPVLFAVNGIVLLAALASAVAWPVVAAMVLTLMSAGLWLENLPGIQTLPSLLGIVGFSALFFFAVGLYLNRRWRRSTGASDSSTMPEFSQHLPALSAVMPFLLLVIASLELPIRQPAPVFGLALLLSVLLLGLVRYQRADAVFPVTAGSVALLLSSWHGKWFEPGQPVLALPWYLFFCALFTAFPFLFHKSLPERRIPWITAALAGPVYFLLVHDAVSRAFGTGYIGLLPALFALAYLGALIWLVRRIPADNAIRQTLLACFGGVVLLFMSLIFPLQFDKEWITLGWALEGMALVWLFQRVAHPGLKVWGAALLAIAFVRLALNPAVFDYHPRTQVPVFNWYLYSYGIGAVCLALTARLWRPREERVLQQRVSSTMLALSTILGFLLLNIEIADYFSTGSTLTFQFSGNLARDMTYSLAWAMFAFVLLLAGVRFVSKAARFASLGLLLVTAVKVFLHDLWQLGQLYRVASLVGLAVFLIVVSFLYQRLLSPSTSSEES